MEKKPRAKDKNNKNSNKTDENSGQTWFGRLLDNGAFCLRALIVFVMVGFLLNIGISKIEQSSPRYIPPGKMVLVTEDVNHLEKLHIWCTDESSIKEKKHTTILLEPGEAGFHQSLFNVRELLEKEGYSVCSYDRPGKGYSSPITNHTQTYLELYTETLNRVIKSSLDQTKENNIILIGHGFGANLIASARKFLSKSESIGKDAVKKAILINPLAIYPFLSNRKINDEISGNQKQQKFKELNQRLDSSKKMYFFIGLFSSLSGYLRLIHSALQPSYLPQKLEFLSDIPASIPEFQSISSNVQKSDDNSDVMARKYSIRIRNTILTQHSFWEQSKKEFDDFHNATSTLDALPQEYLHSFSYLFSDNYQVSEDNLSSNEIDEQIWGEWKKMYQNENGQSYSTCPESNIFNIWYKIPCIDVLKRLIAN